MWVLVHWVKTNETSILTDDMVHDKTMLENKNKLGMVKYGDPRIKMPKHGWKAYLAKVIAKSDKKANLVKEEKKFITKLREAVGEVSTKDATAIHSRNRKRTGTERTCVDSSDEEVRIEEDNPKRKKKELQKRKNRAEETSMEILIQKSKEAFQSLSDEESDDLENMTHTELVARVKQLETQLKLEKDLMEFQEDLLKSVSSTIVKTIGDIKVTCGRFENVLATPDKCQAKDKAITTPTNPQSSEKCAKNEGSTNKCELTRYLSEGTILHIKRSPSFQKMVCNIMTAVFTSEEMEHCLVTGKRIKAEDKEKELLDQDKVLAVVEFVQSCYPGTQSSAIRAKMAAKCKDTRHAKLRLLEKEKLKNFEALKEIGN